MENWNKNWNERNWTKKFRKIRKKIKLELKDLQEKIDKFDKAFNLKKEETQSS